MRTFSWWIVAYGLLLIICGLVDVLMGLNTRVSSATVIPCWSGGAIVLAAGLASGQGRRSLRITGICVGILLPLTFAGLFGWRAFQLWRGENQSAASGFTLMTAASLGILWMIHWLRPREGIATRGYAVPVSKASPPAAAAQSRPERQSEAG